MAEKDKRMEAALDKFADHLLEEIIPLIRNGDTPSVLKTLRDGKQTIQEIREVKVPDDVKPEQEDDNLTPNLA